MCTKDGKLLGAQILGSRAGELIHEIQVGKKFKINFAKFFSVIHAYPTYSEVILNAAKKCYIDQLQNNFFVKLFKKIRR
jgi:pyruvate/2-oxoglutarate dehydrogenase complex dihydrolipoamide dehydrogenase (E3) component